MASKKLNAETLKFQASQGLRGLRGFCRGFSFDEGFAFILAEERFASETGASSFDINTQRQAESGPKPDGLVIGIQGLGAHSGQQQGQQQGAGDSADGTKQDIGSIQKETEGNFEEEAVKKNGEHESDHPIIKKELQISVVGVGKIGLAIKFTCNACH